MLVFLFCVSRRAGCSFQKPCRPLVCKTDTLFCHVKIFPAIGLHFFPAYRRSFFSSSKLFAFALFFIFRTPRCLWFSDFFSPIIAPSGFPFSDWQRGPLLTLPFVSTETFLPSWPPLFRWFRRSACPDFRSGIACHGPLFKPFFLFISFFPPLTQLFVLPKTGVSRFECPSMTSNSALCPPSLNPPSPPASTNHLAHKFVPGLDQVGAAQCLPAASLDC